ncbi:hypothetical protein [Chitinophaga filiformis]|uniref:Uncharacterized protein n=1 Tax=Chitinophaga filiformis TaxID=104663 RepID=A0ABY4I7L6_CHIFI|nr:hypothetical protein [Chitinophaga filiformis]UPK72080.1 hypothetical protein MYF79_12375 [Chitinophaga filiformis]
MYTSYIGKKFLHLYRKRHNKSETYSAAQFFEEEFFPLFFRDESHLMHVGNSPFFQRPREEDVARYGGRSLAQFQNLKNKIRNGVPSGATYVGFAAEEIQATSSGQLTNMDFNIDEEEIYASWIGEALAIGVNGGFAMLIDEEEILFSLFSGWKHYRKYLQQTPNVKDKQIETWNGQWLYLALLEDFNEEDFNYSNIEAVEGIGGLAIPTQKWSKVFFRLSKRYPSREIVIYAYNLSQTNTTLGFIKVYLPDIRHLYEFRDKIFINKEGVVLNDKQIESLETFYNFKSACKNGSIGLKAMEPAKLREFMPKGSVPYAQGKDFKFSDETSFIHYHLLKLWIIAMLNKTDLHQLASEVAKSLLDFERKPNRGKKDLDTLSEETRSASNIRTFIDRLTQILEADNREVFRNVVDQVIRMPSDNFPLFVTLIRFEYAYQKVNNN